MFPQKIFVEYLTFCFFWSVLAAGAATTVVLLKRCSYRFHKFYKKTLVLESLFNKMADLKVCNFIEKEISPQLFSCKYRKTLKKSFMYGITMVTASENGWRISKKF